MTEDIKLKPQTIETTLSFGQKRWPLDIKIKIVAGKKENRITIEDCSINNRDIFFDKEGNYSGEGMTINGDKIYQNQNVTRET